MNELNRPEAVVIISIMSVGFGFAYLVLEPYLERNKKHDLVRTFFKLSFSVVMLTVLLHLIVGASWRIPDSLENLWYDLFIIRVNNMPNGAHVWSYVTIPVLYFVILLWSKDEWYSFGVSVFHVFLHEGIWFVFYYLEYWGEINWETEFYADLTFLMLICTFGVIYSIKYSLKSLSLVIGGLFFFDFIWFCFGMPITSTNSRDQMLEYGLTIWANDLSVNAVEVVGWLLSLVLMLVWSYRRTSLNKGKLKIECETASNVPMSV